MPSDKHILSPTDPPDPPTTAASQKNRNLFGPVLLATFLGILGALVFAKLVLFPDAFTPTKLTDKENQVLSHKLQRLDHLNNAPQPEAYKETASSRNLYFSEKELNALIGRNPDLAKKLSIDLSDNLASAWLLVPLDPDLPVLGGQTLKIHTGLNLSYKNQRPVVRLVGISVWGVPLPNAWLGNMKNVDLVETFGDRGGFWEGLANGITDIQVMDGKLEIQLAP